MNNDTLGKFLIKFNDKWRGSYYLTDSLKFSVDRNEAARFFLLKSNSSPIINGDLVTINLGDKVLNVLDNKLTLTSITNKNKTQDTFLISDGSDTKGQISYNTIINFISNKPKHLGLKFDWKLKSTSGESCAILTNSRYDDDNKSFFQFMLERIDIPITQSNLLEKQNSHVELTNTNDTTTKSLDSTNQKMAISKNDFLDGYKRFIVILILIIILVAYLIIDN